MSKESESNDSLVKELKEQVKILKHINKENADLIKHDSTDEITGLLNKDAFFRETRKLLIKYPDEKFLFARIDIDKFQTINALFGYDEGDRLLQYCANRITNVLQEASDSVIGRIDSDIFCLCIKQSDAKRLKPSQEETERFLDGFHQDFRFDISCGLYFLQNTKELLRDVYAKATLAARRCKDKATLHFFIYDEAIDKELIAQQTLSSEMHKALKQEEFVVFFQPKVDLKTKKLAGAEALVRWVHPNKGTLSPNEFIPLFYKNGFISQLDLYVFEKVCSHLKSWKNKGLQLVPISINITHISMSDTDLPKKLFAIMEKHDITKDLIHIEITEGSYSVDTEKSLTCARELHEKGIHLEMDDFGTGISSLTMLQELPIDTIKLDLGFIKSYSEKHSNAGIIHFIVSLARQMQLTLVAEGIETENQLDFLRNIGCDIGQGYLFSKALSYDDFNNVLQNWDVMETKESVLEQHLPIDMNDLWIPDSNFNILFNAIAGAAAIYEATNEVLSIKVLKMNEEYLQVMEVEKSGKHHTFQDLLQLIHAEDLAALQKNFIESIQTKKPSSTVIRRINLPNRNDPKWIRINVRILFQTKTATLLIANLEDITTQKEQARFLEREAKIHEDYKKQLSIYKEAETSGVATINLDDGIELVYANDAFLDMHGCSREYAFSNAKTVLYETIHPNDQAVVLEAFKKILENKQDHFKWTMQIITLDNKTISTVATGVVRYEKDGTYADIVVRPTSATPTSVTKYAE